MRAKKAAAIVEAEGFRTPMPVVEVHRFRGGGAYPVCPRCGITLEREYQSYCDRCGQRLSWRSLRKAKIVLL